MAIHPKTHLLCTCYYCFQEIYYPNLDRGGEGFSTFASTKKAAGGGANFDEEAFFSSIKQVLKRPTTKYRETSLGRSLKEAGNELLENKKISETLYNKLLLQFDRSMLGALKSKASAKIGFKAIELMTYKYFDDIWNFTLRDVELRENNSFANVKQVLYA